MTLLKEIEAFVEGHKSKLWIGVYVLILVFLLYFGLSVPILLGPNLEGK